jgi:hypothetical protein
MKILVSGLMLVSSFAFADGATVTVDLKMYGQYQKNGTNELVSKTIVLSGSAHVSGRMGGENVNQHVDIPATNVDADSVITVNSNNTVRMQNLKQASDQTFNAKVKWNKDGSVQELKIKGRALEKFVLSTTGGKVGDIDVTGGSAKASMDIEDYVCKSDKDLVGVYSCGTRVRITVSVKAD